MIFYFLCNNITITSLSPHPQVKVYPLTQYEHGADDVLVMGTDGLWDVLSNQEVAEAVTGFLANCGPDDQYRHVLRSMFRSYYCSPAADRQTLWSNHTHLSRSYLERICFLQYLAVITHILKVFSEVDEELVRLVT